MKDGDRVYLECDDDNEVLQAELWHFERSDCASVSFTFYERPWRNSLRWRLEQAWDALRHGRSMSNDLIVTDSKRLREFAEFLDQAAAELEKSTGAVV